MRQFSHSPHQVNSTKALGLIFTSIMLLLLCTAMPLQAKKMAHSQDNSVLYFFPLHNNVSNQSANEFNVLKTLPTSTWQLAKKSQQHFGFNKKKIYMQIRPTPSNNGHFLVIEDRYLSSIKIQALVQENFTTDKAHHPQKKQYYTLAPKISIGFRSARLFQLPENTSKVFVIAELAGPAIIPFRFIPQSQADLLVLTNTWSLGLFFGVAFLTLLICGFHYSTLRQKSLGLTCCLVINIMLYILSKSNLEFITDLPIKHLNRLEIQAFILSAIAMSALYIQYFSDESLVTIQPSKTLARLFQAVFLLVLTPLIGYILIQDSSFRLNTFQIFHLPSLILSFVICAIASGLSYKHNKEQGYLLLTWLFLATSLIIEGCTFVGMDYTLLTYLTSLDHLSGIFISVSLIFIGFWSMNHSSIVHKCRTESIQQLFDGVTKKNRDLEINFARSSDMTQEMYREIQEPMKGIMQTLNTKKSNETIQESLVEYIMPLETSLQKLILLGQNIHHTTHAQSVMFRLKTMLNQIPLSFQERATKQQVQIHFEIDQLLPEYVCGDQSLFSKALRLIIEHRLEELTHGSIRLFATRGNDPRSPQVHLKIRIEDSGPPFKQEALEQLSNASPTLGSHDFQLILARDMIYAMSGELRTSYDPLTGNTLHIQIILERVYQAHEKNGHSQNTQGLITTQISQAKHALLFGHFDSAKKTLLTILAELSMKTHMANTQQELASTLFIERPEIIFFEVPSSQECDAIMQSLKQVVDHKKIPIICISPDQALHDHAIEAGAMDFIPASLPIETVQQVFSRLL